VQTQIQQQLSTDEPAIDLSSSVDYRPAQEIAQRQPTLTDKVVGGIETGKCKYVAHYIIEECKVCIFCCVSQNN